MIRNIHACEWRQRVSSAGKQGTVSWMGGLRTQEGGELEPRPDHLYKRVPRGALKETRVDKRWGTMS